MLAPSHPWQLRGYRMFVDDIQRAWAVIGLGETPTQRAVRAHEPGTLGHLSAMMEGLKETAEPSNARVILIRAAGHGSDARHLEDVAGPDVQAFTLVGPGASLHINRQHQSGWIEWRDQATGHEVLLALAPRRVRWSWLPIAWQPYRVRFIPTSKAEHRETVRHRTRLWVGVPGAVVTALGLLAVVWSWVS